MAVAGFGQDEIKVDVKEQTLTVAARRRPRTKERQFLHRGIAARTFERRFQLADHVEVKGADLKDGLLHIDLVRNVPERLKPRTIAIGNGKAAKQVEAACLTAAGGLHDARGCGRCALRRPFHCLALSLCRSASAIRPR